MGWLVVAVLIFFSNIASAHAVPAMQREGCGIKGYNVKGLKQEEKYALLAEQLANRSARPVSACAGGCEGEGRAGR